MDWFLVKVLVIIILGGLVMVSWINYLMEEQAKAKGWWICEYCGSGWDKKEKKCKGCGSFKTN